MIFLGRSREVDDTGIIHQPELNDLTGSGITMTYKRMIEPNQIQLIQQEKSLCHLDLAMFYESHTLVYTHPSGYFVIPNITIIFILILFWSEIDCRDILSRSRPAYIPSSFFRIPHPNYPPYTSFDF